LGGDQKTLTITWKRDHLNAKATKPLGWLPLGTINRQQDKTIKYGTKGEPLDMRKGTSSTTLERKGEKLTERVGGERSLKKRIHPY